MIESYQLDDGINDQYHGGPFIVPQTVWDYFIEFNQLKARDLSLESSNHDWGGMLCEATSTISEAYEVYFM